MTEFGETLRQAREAKGLSIQQIADATNMLPQQIEDLENDNFSRIAAPIYGRGFVKLYCSTVGLDPKPLVQEFMEIYNGNKQPTIKFKRTQRNAEPVAKQQPTMPSAPAQPQPQPQPPAPQPTMPTQPLPAEDFSAIRQAAVTPQPPPPPPPPPPEPAHEISPAQTATAPGAFAQETLTPADTPYRETTTEFASMAGEPAYSGQSAAQAMRQAVEAQPFRLEQEVVSAPQPPKVFASSRYSTPPPTLEPDSRYSDFYVPPVVWRSAIVVAVVCLVGWLLFALGSKVWRAATTEPAETPAAETLPGAPEDTQKPNDSTVSAQSTPAKPRQQRTPMKLPPLYFE